MKRVWKPLDVAHGYRLYQVQMRFPGLPAASKDFIVAASSPSEAARLIEKTYEGAKFVGGCTPVFSGHALNIYQPAEWWRDGLPQDDRAVQVQTNTGVPIGACSREKGQTWFAQSYVDGLAAQVVRYVGEAAKLREAVRRWRDARAVWLAAVDDPKNSFDARNDAGKRFEEAEQELLQALAAVES